VAIINEHEVLLFTAHTRFDQSAFLKVQRACGVFRAAGVVGDHDERLAEFLGEPREQFHDDSG
jgi:hypothetical protein